MRDHADGSSGPRPGLEVWDVAKLIAKGSIRPKPLQRVLGEARKGYTKHYDDWQEMFGGFRGHLPPDQKERLKALGLTLWRFDLRFRWAVGITALEFDDRIITKASTGSTREGYFLLMRLVDLWFSLDLAHDLYARVFLPDVTHPSVITTLRRDLKGPMQAVREAARVCNGQIKERFRKPDKREQLVTYVRKLADYGPPSTTTQFTGEAADQLEQRKALTAAHLIALAQAIRNRYVHGGETASTGTFGSEEKIRLLRLLVGFAQVAGMALVSTATDEMLRQLKRQMGIRG